MSIIISKIKKFSHSHSELLGEATSRHQKHQRLLLVQSSPSQCLDFQQESLDGDSGHSAAWASWRILTLLDGTNTLSRNSGNKPTYDAQQLEDLNYKAANAWDLAGTGKPPPRHNVKYSVSRSCHSLLRFTHWMRGCMGAREGLLPKRLLHLDTSAP